MAKKELDFQEVTEKEKEKRLAEKQKRLAEIKKKIKKYKTGNFVRSISTTQAFGYGNIAKMFEVFGDSAPEDIEFLLKEIDELNNILKKIFV